MSVNTGTKAKTTEPTGKPARPDAAPPGQAGKAPSEKPREIGGRAGPEPTRYGDWEVKGICVDF